MSVLLKRACGVGERSAYQAWQQGRSAFLEKRKETLCASVCIGE
jgi:hypothetical protein